MDKKVIIVIVGLILVSISVSVGLYFATSEPEANITTSTPVTTQPPPKVWTKTQTIDKVGGKGGPYKIDQICEDSYVDGINVKYDAYVDSVGIKCSDGKVFENQGGKGGKLGKIDYEGGFTNIEVKSANYVDKIGTMGGNGGTSKILKCGPDEKIMGIYGQHGSWVDSLGVYCGKLQ